MTRISACRIRSGTCIPGHPPVSDIPVPFSTLLTLVSSSNAESAADNVVGLHRPYHRLGVTPRKLIRNRSMRWSAMPSTITAISLLPAKTYREPTPGRARRR